MNSETLILIAPASLLLGAALQILAARFCSARAKGILAFLCALPAIVSVAWTVASVQAGQAIERNLLHWDGPLALVLHVDALSVLFALMGTGLGAFVLLYSIGYMAHDKSATRFYASMLVFIGGLCGAGLQRQPLYLLPLLGGGRPVLLQPGGLLVHQPRGGGRRAQSAADDAHCGLRLAGGHSGRFITAPAARSGPIRAWLTHFTGGIFVLMLVALVAKIRASSRCIPGFPKPWPRPLRSAPCCTPPVT